MIELNNFSGLPILLEVFSSFDNDYEMQSGFLFEEKGLMLVK